MVMLGEVVGGCAQAIGEFPLLKAVKTIHYSIVLLSVFRFMSTFRLFLGLNSRGACGDFDVFRGLPHHRWSIRGFPPRQGIVGLNDS